MKRALEKLHDQLEKKGLKKPFVIRATAATARKIAEALGETWPHEVKSKQEIGPFLIIA